MLDGLQPSNKRFGRSFVPVPIQAIGKGHRMPQELGPQQQQEDLGKEGLQGSLAAAEGAASKGYLSAAVALLTTSGVSAGPSCCGHLTATAPKTPTHPASLLNPDAGLASAVPAAAACCSGICSSTNSSNPSTVGCSNLVAHIGRASSNSARVSSSAGRVSCISAGGPLPATSSLSHPSLWPGTPSQASLSQQSQLTGPMHLIQAAAGESCLKHNRAEMAGCPVDLLVAGPGSKQAGKPVRERESKERSGRSELEESPPSAGHAAAEAPAPEDAINVKDGSGRHRLDCALTFSLTGRITGEEQQKRQMMSRRSDNKGNTLFDPGFALQLPAGFIECDI